MKKYFSFFRIRFNAGLQYRAAALAGVATQFAWGFMTIMLFRAFYKADPVAFPMTLEQLTAYMWLRQAFLALFAVWVGLDNDIFEAITSGNVAYELVRPMDLYTMWYTKNLSSRISNAALRCVPLLAVAAFIPKPYGITLPPDSAAMLGFIVTMILGLLVTCSFVMLIYIATFYTMQPSGVRMIALSLADFLCGDLVPLPFFPEKLRAFMELTPFAAMSNVPYRIYSGNIAGTEIVQSITLQIFWLTVMLIIGKTAMNRVLRRAVIQGG